MRKTPRNDSTEMGIVLNILVMEQRRSIEEIVAFDQRSDCPTRASWKVRLPERIVARCTQGSGKIGIAL